MGVTLLQFNAGRQHQTVPACPPGVLSGAESIVRSRRFKLRTSTESTVR